MTTWKLDLEPLPEELEAKVLELRAWHSIGHSESCQHRRCVELRRELAEAEVLDFLYTTPVRYGLKVGNERMTPRGLDVTDLKCIHMRELKVFCHECEYMWKLGIQPVVMNPVPVVTAPIDKDE